MADWEAGATDGIGADSRAATPLWRDLLWPFALFVAGTAPFLLWPLDQQVQAFFYRDGEWWGTSWPAEKWIYMMGPWPGLFLAVVCLVVFAAGFGSGRFERMARWRKASLAVMLVALLGPGLITNLILKDNWGRPRPRAVEAYGGTMPFEPVLHRDSLSDGKSFPCGHATMGFLFLTPALMLRRWSSVRWAGLAMGGFALGFGALIGFARVSVGGHFFSDVIWAAGLMWLVAVALHHGLRLERSLFYKRPEGVHRPVPAKWWIAGGAGAAALVAASVATPYGRDHSESVAEWADGADRLRMELDLVAGSLRFAECPDWMLEHQASGHAIPGSRVKLDLGFRRRESTVHVKASHQPKGVFGELEATMRMGFPAGLARLDVTGRLAGGSRILLPEHAMGQRWDIEVPSGDLILLVPPGLKGEAEVTDRSGDQRVAVGGEDVRESGGTTDVRLRIRAPRGTVRFVHHSGWAENSGPVE